MATKLKKKVKTKRSPKRTKSRVASGRTSKRNTTKKKAVRKKKPVKKVTRARKTTKVIRLKKRSVRKTIKRSSPRASKSRTVYAIDPEFEFLKELRELILKASPTQIDKMTSGIARLGRIKVAIVSGLFLDKEHADPTVADLLLVADDIDRRKLWAFLKGLEAEIGKEIKFTVLDIEEFKYRLQMFDRFVRVILEGPHKKLIDKLQLDI